MDDSCPNCKIKVIFGKKEKLIDCLKCKSKLLLVTINGTKEIYDATPREDLKK